MSSRKKGKPEDNGGRRAPGTAVNDCAHRACAWPPRDPQGNGRTHPRRRTCSPPSQNCNQSGHCLDYEGSRTHCQSGRSERTNRPHPSPRNHRHQNVRTSEGKRTHCRWHPVQRKPGLGVCEIDRLCVAERDPVTCAPHRKVTWANYPDTIYGASPTF